MIRKAGIDISNDMVSMAYSYYNTSIRNRIHCTEDRTHYLLQLDNLSRIPKMRELGISKTFSPSSSPWANR